MSDFINEQFRLALNSAEGIEKLASEGSTYLRTKLRERAFSRHIINPVKVTAQQCTRSLTHEGFVKIIDIEPDSMAMPVNFRGMPDGNYIQGDKYQIGFFGIASQIHQKTEQELATYEMPITKVVEENTIKDVEAVEDTGFIVYTRRAIDMAEAVLGAGSKKLNVPVVDYNDLLDGLIDGINLVEQADKQGPTAGATRPCGTILMNQQTFMALHKMDHRKLGLELRAEVTKEGYKYDRILGKRLVVTMKSNLVLPGEVFFFAPQEYLGNFFILNDTRFYLAKHLNMVEYMGLEEIAMGIQNINALAKIQFSKI